MGYKSGRLFEVPIGSDGKVVVTRLGERVYMLMWNSAPDNRLTTSFCNAVHTALDILALKYPHGVVITTSGISKFYSNGLDLEHANSNPTFTKDSLFALWKRLLTRLHGLCQKGRRDQCLGLALLAYLPSSVETDSMRSRRQWRCHKHVRGHCCQYEAGRQGHPALPTSTPDRCNFENCIDTSKLTYENSYPMPTIALINGHGFAGALMTAMMHDYRIMNPHRGYICLNEVELGVPLKAAMSSIFRQKTSPQTYRTLVLEGKRFKALEALEAGIIDGVGGLDEVVAFVDELKLVEKTDKGVYGLLKREMWRETVAFLDAPDEEVEYKEKVAKQDEELEKKAHQRVKDWEAVKAKL
ncbi:hypothetical protein AUEXF2481DRAFT_25013 [Aureobasidium subglaciale EXF-2481]|uniref:Carnitinyl-CoA dehydratase n=1 Tax=Aureobasidium subglaciale (strain EXF-2481) TaxID=1043005 RepID=A0A074YSR2_AURSE|nr:uncharacterized protein AUEXF2481DRAFT_25013 [Aureobasidium subglaciale EXF-2481]KAI5210269.1 putative carnitinyl-CoA dehydratase [Aureobasidium subglaciale]KAI5229041.1 putative carnitinyl-CoA dehydratase [Aureobasidium subglaciale]KAI5232795.1 putative carnitinyl-CoA dehydratase [Aureobasidium subglaciale]KAI5265999.1 putative carnitinyl-CoA dehydratase [Aureobasidium subglaciale]KER00721.1 hypothetical protein AUEXF2481DRAFT_25013 [Aureobasidium subglaciale EXF-2481]